MGIVRNIVFTVVTTAALIASLLFIIPGNTATAAAVTLTPGSVSGIDNGFDGNPNTTADNFFEVAVQVDIAAGEHIPLDFVEVGISNSAQVDGFGLLHSVFCAAHSTGAMTPGGPHLQIVSVHGAARSQGPFSGYGYTIDINGYGYGAVPAPSQADFSDYHGGVGYGYGYDTPGADTVTMVLRVYGCAMPFDALHPSATVHMQVLLGGSFTATSSFPPLFVSPVLEASFFYPGFHTNVETAVEELTATVQTQGGNSVFTFGTPTGANIPAGDAFELDLGANAGGIQSLTIVSEIPIPAGSQFVFTVRDLSADPNADDLIDHPLYGISPTAMQSHMSNPPLPPVLFFELELRVPGASETDLNEFVSALTFKFDVPQAYFAANGLTLAASIQLNLVGFDSTTGDYHAEFFPGAVDCTTVPTVCTVTYSINQFSSFALVVGAPRGGGGGGGSTLPGVTGTSTVTVTGTSTQTGSATSTAQPGTGTATGPVKGASGSGKPGIPGPSAPLLALALVGAVLLARRKLAK
ncbi:MAG TPA: hypothetical protein VM286_00625 [Candidatus Thermoplasmatota archaeon]|nr:hypothetical protein [Candidatus Thermoplasmatota archaeon]